MMPKATDVPKARTLTRLQKKAAGIRVAKLYKRKGKEMAIWGPKFTLPKHKPKKNPGYRYKSIPF